jgi:hypothetical protein
VENCFSHSPFERARDFSVAHRQNIKSSKNKIKGESELCLSYTIYYEWWLRKKRGGKSLGKLENSFDNTFSINVNS